MSHSSEDALKGGGTVVKILGGSIAAVILAAIIGLFGFLVYRGIFYTWTDNYHVVYVFDSRGGSIEQKSYTGYIWAHPWWQYVHTIDSRPMQVCINANTRVLNCKLVKFNPSGLMEFLKLHGRGDYNEIGPGGNLNEILKSYAYEGSGKTYPFLEIVTELMPSGGQK